MNKTSFTLPIKEFKRFKVFCIQNDCSYKESVIHLISKFLREKVYVIEKIKATCDYNPRSCRKKIYIDITDEEHHKLKGLRLANRVSVRYLLCLAILFLESTISQNFKKSDVLNWNKSQLEIAEVSEFIKVSIRFINVNLKNSS